MANAIDDVNLLPCPFCGGSNVFLRDYDPEQVWIECDDCQVGTLRTLGWPECNAAWNRRASPAPSQHTGWSDEAVARAILGHPGVFVSASVYERLVDKICAALSAASSIAPATGFEVKALEWTEYPNSFYPDVFGHCWDAITPFGRYTIEEGSASDSAYYEANFGQTIIVISDGLPEAKAACFADLDRRIRSTLSPSVAKESGEPIKAPWPTQPMVFMTGENEGVLFDPQGKFHGWIMRQHPDGMWVSVRKLEAVDPEDNPFVRTLRP